MRTPADETAPTRPQSPKAPRGDRVARELAMARLTLASGDGPAEAPRRRAFSRLREDAMNLVVGRAAGPEATTQHESRRESRRELGPEPKPRAASASSRGSSRGSGWSYAYRRPPVLRLVGTEPDPGNPGDLHGAATDRLAEPPLIETVAGAGGGRTRAASAR